MNVDNGVATRSLCGAPLVDICPIGLVRSCGLPFKWIDEIAEPEIADAIDRSSGPNAHHLAEQAWDSACVSLRSVAARDVFQLAVACSNPEVYERAMRPFAEGAPRHQRKRARVVAAYLQRFTTKNDIAAGFGPRDRVLLGGEDDLLVPTATIGTWARRAGILSWWAVQAIADRISADPRLSGMIPRRWTSGAAMGADGALLVDGEKVPVTLDLRGWDWSVELLTDAVGRRLQELGVVRQDLQVPPGQPDPAVWLEERLTFWGTAAALDWAARVRAFRDSAQAISEMPAPGRASALKRLETEIGQLIGRGLDGPRHAGEFYADRRVMFEEALGTTDPVRIGGGLAQRIQAALAPALKLAGAYGYALHSDAREWLRSELDGAEVALSHVARLCHDVGRHGHGDRLASALKSEILRVMDDDCHIEPASLEEVLDRHPTPALTLASPDLMLDFSSRPAPGARLVLGEVHSSLWTLGLSQMLMLDAAGEQWAEETLREDAEDLGQLVGPRTAGKIYFPEFGGWSVEFEALALRGRRVPFGLATIRWRDRGVVVKAPSGEEFEMLPVEPDKLFYRALSPHLAELPHLGAGTYTKAIDVGDLQIQRPTWTVSMPNAPADAAEQFVYMRRWRRAARLPERIFVRTPGYMKPFFVDFRSPLLLDVFCHWISPGQSLSLTAVDPECDGLWLRRGEDLFASELRLSAVVRGVRNG